VFLKDTVDAELSRELAFHFEKLVQESADAGLPIEEARHAARRAIGNLPLLEEQCRDHRTVGWLHDLHQDFAYGLRMLWKNPGFTGVAVISLALGIGANTAILSVLTAVLGDRLPMPHDDRVVVVRTFPRANPQQETHASLTDYFAWREENRSFDLMGVSLGNQADFGADGDAAPAERIQGQAVTGDMLSVLGVQPLLGRVFTASESQPDTPDRIIVISHRLWQRRFGARADVIGQQVRLNRVNWTVIGVMPEPFRYPNEGSDYWIPLRPDRSRVTSPERFFVVTARLKPGVTIEQAQDDLNGIAARLAREVPERHAGWSVRVKPLREAMFGWTREPLLTLGAAVALVLLVACANLAGLLLARGLVRVPEMAMRTAMGASRGRLVRQLLTESLLLSIAGGTLGVLVALSGIEALMALQPPPGGVGILDVDVNPRAVIVTALISIVTGVLFGLAPALMGTRAGLNEALKQSPTSAGAGLHPRLRSALVAAQIAVTVVLLVGSGLLMKSFVRLVSRDVHFDPARLLTFELHMPTADYMHPQGSVGGLPYFEISPSPSRTQERVLRGLRGVTGAESVAGISYPLLNSVVQPSVTIRPETSVDSARGTPTPAASLAIGVGSVPEYVSDSGASSAVYLLVTPGFFATIKASLVRGRDIAERDTASSQWVAIVNETAARTFWPGEDPIGQRFTIPIVPDERPREVIGVVRDIPLSLAQSDPRPVIYASYLQQPTRYPLPGANMFGRMTFLLRSAGDPILLLPAARRVVAAVDADWPMANVVTMEQQIGSRVPQRGYFVFVITAFALTATLLAAIGIYGVMAYSVAQRIREIGIRVTLGAGAREVALLVGRRALLLVVLGLSTGLIGSLGLTRLLQSQLWGVTPNDPLTFAVVIVLLALVALAAAFFPIRRAAGVNPTVALRSE
jgi:putative ABC transport system permease protein